MMDSGWLLVVVWLWWVSPGQTLDPDLSDLSLLPLDKLLAVKRSLIAQYQPSPDVSLDEGFLNDSQRMSPGALPLRGPMTRRGGPPTWVEEESWTTGGHHSSHPSSYKGKKLSAIFHGTVTVLAFLAFGGYLLCLILHVLKEKKAALTMTLLTTTEEPARRRRAADASGTAEDAYLALRRLAEGYARYNTLLTTTEEPARRRRAADASGTAEDAYLALRRLAEGYARYNTLRTTSAL